MTIGEIFIKLGFKADTFTLRDFGRSLADLPVKALGAVGSIAGVSFELINLVSRAMDAAQGFSIFSAQTGLSSKELQKWQNVAEQVGVSGETVKGAILGINNALGSIRTGRGQAALMAFGQLGIDWRGRTVYQILDQLRQRAGRMDPQIVTQWLGGLGVSPEMMRLFRMPQKQFAQFAGAAGVMSEKDIEAAANFKRSLTALALMIEHSVVPLMTRFAEIVDGLNKALKPWLDKEVSDLGRVMGMSQNDWNDVKSFMNPTSRQSFVTGLSPWNLLQAIRAGGVPEQAGDMTLNQYIYSTATPEQVGRHAAEEATRQRVLAAKHFGNGGS